MLSKVLTAMLFIGCGSGEVKLGADTGAPALSEPSADQDTGVSQDSGGGAS